MRTTMTDHTRPTVYLRMPPGDGEPPSRDVADLVWLPVELRDHGDTWVDVRLSLTTADTYELGKLAFFALGLPIPSVPSMQDTEEIPVVVLGPERREGGR